MFLLRNSELFPETKIILVRNNFQLLEQQINAHEKLSDAEKVEMQPYTTRSYGLLTTFNVLFQENEDQFKPDRIVSLEPGRSAR